MSARGLAEILSLGMVTPVGLDAISTAAAVRAGIVRLREAPLFNREGKPIVMGFVPDEHLPPIASALARELKDDEWRARLLQCASPALREVTSGLKSGEPVAVCLAVPDGSSKAKDPIGPEFLVQLSTQTEVNINSKLSKVLPVGRAGGIHALSEALKLLQDRSVTHVVVGGVDTNFDQGVVAALDDDDRLAVGSASDAVIPGEGAGFLLLGTSRSSSPPRPQPVASLIGVGLGTEPGHIYSKEPNLGEGLSQAFAALFAKLPDRSPKVQCVYAGFNGENVWHKDWGVAYLRHSEYFTDAFQTHHIADSFGDPGAALGPLMIGVAAIGLQRGYRQGPCLVWCGSDRGERGAVLLQHFSR